GRLTDSGSRPKAAAAHFMRVGFARHVVADAGRSWVRWCRTSGKAGDGHVEASPEEMHRARLADKGRTELFQRAVDLDQQAPEVVGINGIVGGVHPVLFKRDRVRDLDRYRPYACLQPEGFEPTDNPR